MERMIPARFRKLAMAFDEVAKFKPCESSGSEHSPDSSLTDLSELVNSFLEEDDFQNGCNNEGNDGEVNRSDSDELSTPDAETREELQSLIGYELDESRMSIRDEVEMALLGLDGVNFDKRKLMTRLRERGLDVGLCKSKWDKTGRIPSGEFEYMDINMRNTRFIIEINLASQFEIARPTKSYMQLLHLFPEIYIGKVEELKRVVRIMCAAIKVSLKSADMAVAPWRRNRYMQVKWFGSYKRTTNAVSDKVIRSDGENELKSRAVGFKFDALIPKQQVRHGCRSEYGEKGTRKYGHLAAAFAIETVL